MKDSSETLRACESCGESMDKKVRRNGRLETPAEYQLRRFCSTSCANKALKPGLQVVRDEPEGLTKAGHRAQLRLSRALRLNPEVPCKNDPDLWLSPKTADRQMAAQICRAECPLLKICQTAARASEESYGTFGGIDFTHRRRAA